MAIGDPVKVYQGTLASGLTIMANPIDVGQSYSRIYLEVPSMSSAGTLYVQAASTRGGTYRRVSTASDLTADFEIPASIIGDGSMVPIPGGFQYYKVESTSGTTDAVTTFKIIGG